MLSHHYVILHTEFKVILHGASVKNLIPPTKMEVIDIDIEITKKSNSPLQVCMHNYSTVRAK